LRIPVMLDVKKGVMSQPCDVTVTFLLMLQQHESFSLLFFLLRLPPIFVVTDDSV
jgi:hypothetical protein